jgi:hypothetical protein
MITQLEYSTLKLKLKQMNSNNKTARIAGVLYLIVAVAGMFGLMYVPSKLIVSGDATTTANNIMASEGLYRLGIVAELVCQTSFLLLAIALYKLLKHVNKLHAISMVAFVVVAVPIAFMNAVNEFAVLVLLSGDDYLRTFTTEQLQAQMTIFLKLHDYGNIVAFIFWGLWLFPLGYLVFTSGLFPKVLGVLLMAGCFAYLIDFSVTIFFPDHRWLTYPGSAISAIAEFSFLLWLLIKGVKKPSVNYTVSVN